MNFRSGGHLLGLHRVVEPRGALPQAALELDASAPGFDNEVVIEVSTLNIDSASFHQIVEEVGRDEEAVADHIVSIVANRKKMQNPVTGSGGMLLGTVFATGPKYSGPVEVADRVATLVSLTLTPLDLRKVKSVNFDTDQIEVEATAYLPPSAPIVTIPDDIEETIALSALDVCGAPAQTQRLVKGARSVLILGAGKSGTLCAAAARKTMGPYGLIYGFDLHEHNLERLSDAGLVDVFKTGDATDPVGVLDAVLAMTGGELVDVVINTCNVPGVEMSAILGCRDRGKVYFFNMATDFSRAALGSEGIGRDVDLLIGNGYARGHAQLTLELVREYDVVRDLLKSARNH